MKPVPADDTAWARLRLVGESSLPGPLKDTLRALLAYADWKHGGNIFVSVAVLAKSMSLQERAAHGRLSSLVQCGVLVGDGVSPYNTAARAINFDRLAALAGDGRKPGRKKKAQTPATECTPATSCTPPLQPDAGGPLQPNADKHPTEQPTNIQHLGSDAEKPKDRKRTTANTASRIGWTIDVGWHGINADDRQAWSDAYPLVNIDAELAKMNAWLRANPAKANKTAWARFIVSWLARSTPQPTASTPAMSPDKEAAIRARIAFYERHPQTRQAHIAALKAMDPRYAKASDASILRAMPDAMLAMPATPATTKGITNA